MTSSVFMWTHHTWKTHEFYVTIMWLVCDFCMTIMWVCPDYHVICMWQPQDCQMIPLWPRCDFYMIFHMAVTWLPCDSHKIITWLRTDHHMIPMWPSHYWHMILTSLSCNSHVISTWPSCDSMLFPCGRHMIFFLFCQVIFFRPSYDSRVTATWFPHDSLMVLAWPHGSSMWFLCEQYVNFREHSCNFCCPCHKVSYLRKVTDYTLKYQYSDCPCCSHKAIKKKTDAASTPAAPAVRQLLSLT